MSKKSKSKQPLKTNAMRHLDDLKIEYIPQDRKSVV